MPDNEKDKLLYLLVGVLIGLLVGIFLTSLGGIAIYKLIR